MFSFYNFLSFRSEQPLSPMLCHEGALKNPAVSFYVIWNQSIGVQSIYETLALGLQYGHVLRQYFHSAWWNGSYRLSEAILHDTDCLREGVKQEAKMHHIPSIWKLYRHLYWVCVYCKIKLKIRLKWDQEHLIYFFHKTKLSSALLHNAYIRPKLQAHRLSSFIIKTWTKTLTQNIMANQMDMLHPVISSHYFSMRHWRCFAEKQTQKGPFDQCVNTLDDTRGNSDVWWYYSDDWVQEPGQTGPEINKHCVHIQHCAHLRVPLSVSCLLCLKCPLT